MRYRNQVTRKQGRKLLDDSVHWSAWERRIYNVMIANHYDVEHQRPLSTKEDNKRSHHKGKSDFLGVGKVDSPAEGTVAVVEAKTGSSKPTDEQLAYLERWRKVPGVIVCGVYYPKDYRRLVKELGGKEAIV